MSRIDEIFAAARRRNQAALMPFITGGYPSLEATRDTLPALEAAGASVVEIGFPFSDPIADGPTIAASMHEALQQGVTPQHLFELVEGVRPNTALGLIAMVSQSIVSRIGEKRFIERAARAGFDGLIIPDADTAADCDSGAAAIAEAARDAGLSCTFLIAPTTSTQRMARVCELCSGFVYVLARVGITGEHAATPVIAERIALVREHTDLPVAVGFGISTVQHVAAVAEHADAAIVGSALVRRMGEAQRPVEAAAAFVRELAAGLLRRPLHVEER